MLPPGKENLRSLIGLEKSTGARESQLKPSKNCFKKLPIGHFSPELRKTTLDRSGCYRNAISRLSVKTRILPREEVKKQRNIFSVWMAKSNNQNTRPPKPARADACATRFVRNGNAARWRDNRIHNEHSGGN